MKFYTSGCKFLLAVFFALALNTSTKAQTTLATGDIVFTGYHSGAVGTDAFSFVILVPVTNNTVINFTDNAWLNPGVFRTGEQTVTWTVSGSLVAGTEITIQGPSAGAATATVLGSGINGVCTGTMPSLATTGDQVFAYQGTAASPTFITGIHMNVYSVDIFDCANTVAASWDPDCIDGAGGTVGNTIFSKKPAVLTTSVDAVWIGTAGVGASEFDNAVFTGCGLPLTTAAQVRAAVNDPANWTKSNGVPATPLPAGCNFMGAFATPPSFTLDPSNSSICENTGTSFTVTATGATSYQWQVDNGGGFANVVNNANYSGAATTTLTLTNIPASFNGYLYRAVATNPAGSTNSNPATLTVIALPANPTLLSKTPASGTVADGTPVSATFNAGTGGTGGGCTDDYRYTTNGGASYLPYTPGNNISTTGVAAGSGFVFIEGRRSGCGSGCNNNYVVLASWVVTPLPATPTTLVAGDIAFSGYASNYPLVPQDNFSFVLLRNIGPGTTITFTDNGWLSTNVLQSAEQTLTWTAPAGGLPGGTEIRITDLTVTRAGGGAAGTVTGTGLSLNTSGDQILAYQGTAASPTFISAIHMNVYSTANGDPVTTTAAAWDGTANTTNSSALPTGLTTGVNAIWIGTQAVPASEFDNSRYGNCSGPGVLGPITALRAALNNQANWISDNNQPPSFTLPTGCNYLSAICETITFTSAAGTNAQTVCVNSPITNITYSTTAATGATFSGLPAGVTGSWAANVATISGTPTVTGTFNYTVTATGPCGGAVASGSITVNDQPTGPTLLAKTPDLASICSGTGVSATFNAGSGGVGCSDDYTVEIDGGSPVAYTPGSTVGASATSSIVIKGRRANCAAGAGCTGTAYTILASWTVVAQPTGPTLLAKTPDLASVCAGTEVSATFNAGSGGVGCSDDYTVEIDGGSPVAYTPGSNVGASATSSIIIKGRRANCDAGSGCNGTAYTVLASWTVVAQPTGPTLLAKTPDLASVCAGTEVSATFNAGSGGEGCSDDYTVEIDGGSPVAYTPGSNVGASATSSIVIKGRRANCTDGAGCNGTAYTILASWTVVAQPTGPTLLAKTPNQASICSGTGVSATFNPGSGGTGCSDDYTVEIDGGGPVAYTPGSTVGASATSSIVIRGRRANCTAGSGCNGTAYTILASWTVNVAPTVNAPTVVQPTCATPTGTITVNATGSGTLEYSIDGGTNWSLSNVFGGLAPGNYNIAVRSQDAPSCVGYYSGNPVVLNAATGCCTPVDHGTIASGNQTICYGGDPSNITFSVAPSGGAVVGGSFNYQWYYKNGVGDPCPTGTNVSGWTLIAGATGSSYDPPAGLTTSRTYAVTVDPTGTPDCGPATWANSCRKVTVNPAVVATCSNNNPTLYFGYAGDQTATVTAVASGGTAPYTVSITMNRPLKCNIITSSGDEVWTASGGTSTNNVCPASGPGSTPVSTNTVAASGGSYSVNVTLMEDAIITATVTDANGCVSTCTTSIHAEDVRCFAGNSGNAKVKICHKTGNGCHEICVNESAVAAHLAHGDFLGDCTPDCVAPPTRGVVIVKETVFGVKVIPNPTDNYFTLDVEGGSNEKIVVMVYDVLGRVVKRIEKSNNQLIRFGEDMSRGSYMAVVTQGNNTMTVKLVKQ